MLMAVHRHCGLARGKQAAGRAAGWLAGLRSAAEHPLAHRLRWSAGAVCSVSDKARRLRSHCRALSLSVAAQRETKQIYVSSLHLRDRRMAAFCAQCTAAQANCFDALRYDWQYLVATMPPSASVSSRECAVGSAASACATQPIDSGKCKSSRGCSFICKQLQPPERQAGVLALRAGHVHLL
jgi:hypothetical protein